MNAKVTAAVVAGALGLGLGTGLFCGREVGRRMRLAETPAASGASSALDPRVGEALGRLERLERVNATLVKEGDEMRSVVAGMRAAAPATGDAGDAGREAGGKAAEDEAAMERLAADLAALRLQVEEVHAKLEGGKAKGPEFRTD